jgi:uncharacterized protein YecE (DUF72 family)
MGPDSLLAPVANVALPRVKTRVMARIYIGLSGYSYKAWQGPDRFYPEKLKPGDFLRHYASRFDTVELDGTWYRMPSEQAVRYWADQTRDGFVFCPKAHRQITHLRRLKPEALSSLQFMMDRLSPLAACGRLGPVLLQLPPNLRRDDDRLGGFLSRLPKETRWAIEFRHVSWHVPEIEALLRAHGVSWVAAETDDAPAELRRTAEFCYLRLRRTDYSDAALSEWAGWLKDAANSGTDCFVFLKHEDEGAPWILADRLVQLVRVP